MWPLALLQQSLREGLDQLVIGGVFAIAFAAARAQRVQVDERMVETANRRREAVVDQHVTDGLFGGGGVPARHQVEGGAAPVTPQLGQGRCAVPQDVPNRLLADFLDQRGAVDWAGGTAYVVECQREDAAGHECGSRV